LNLNKIRLRRDVPDQGYLGFIDMPERKMLKQVLKNKNPQFLL